MAVTRVAWLALLALAACADPPPAIARDPDPCRVYLRDSLGGIRESTVACPRPLP